LRKFAKFILLFFAFLCSALIAAPQEAEAAPAVTIIVNGAEVKADQSPYIVEGVTMVPLRFISEALGGNVGWDGSARTASVIKDGLFVSVTIGNKVGLVNGQSIPLLRSAELKNGRTFVPLRFFAEGLGAIVGWDQSTWTVSINLNESEPPVLKEKIISGYYYDKNSLPQLSAYANTFTDVIHFGYLLTADGTVREKDNFSKDLFDSQGKALAEGYGANTLMLVTAFDKTISDAVLSDPVMRAKAIASIREIVILKDFDGVDLDFEAVSVSCREYYPAFVRELKAALGSKYIVSLSLPSRNNDRQTWKDGYDYAALAAAADRVNVMFYDQHYSGGAPGPIGGADWVEEGINYLLKYIPAHKMVLGIGAYGRNWPEGSSARTIYMDSALPFAIEKGAVIMRDEASGVPYFTYIDEEGIKHEVWYEDTQSLCQKVEFVNKYGLAGFTVWRMGFPPDDTWQALVNIVK